MATGSSTGKWGVRQERELEREKKEEVGEGEVEERVVGYGGLRRYQSGSPKWVAESLA